MVRDFAYTIENKICMQLSNQFKYTHKHTQQDLFSKDK